jgi:flagellar biogenesis protein FliO
MRLFLGGLFFVLLVIAVVGWVVRPFAAMASWDDEVEAPS